MYKIAKVKRIRASTTISASIQINTSVSLRMSRPRQTRFKQKILVNVKVYVQSAYT